MINDTVNDKIVQYLRCSIGLRPVIVLTNSNRSMKPIELREMHQDKYTDHWTRCCHKCIPQCKALVMTATQNMADKCNINNTSI